MNNNQETWYTASSGMPLGEINHRLVVVADSHEAASAKLEEALQQEGWQEESGTWIWAGAGSQSFASEAEAKSFADYLMS